MRQVELPPTWTPYAVTGDAAGDVWTTLLTPAGLGRLHAGEPGFESIPGDGRPMLLAVDPAGALWYSCDDDRLGRRDPGGRHSSIAVTAGSAPYGLAVAPGGALWFTAPGINRIGRLAPGGAISLFDIPVPDSRAAMLAVDDDGTVWAALNGAGALARIRDGATVEIVALPAGSAPVGVAAAGSGVWYADIAGGSVGRVTPDGAVERVRLGDPACRPHAVAADPAGGCWVTLWGSGQLARVTGGGDVIRHDLPGEEPHGLWVGATEVWVAMESGSLVAVPREPRGEPGVRTP